MELYCGTGNKGKLREFQRAAGDGLTIKPFGPLDCPETGDPFEANASQKALCYSKSLGTDELLFADDSGIEADALNKVPGVYSARYAGVGATDEENNTKLLRELEGIAEEDRTGRFVCVIALVRGSEVLGTFRDTVEGFSLKGLEGDDGCGYDPLVYFPPQQCAFGMLTPEEKWEHSHRGKAFRQMLDWLRQR